MTLRVACRPVNFDNGSQITYQYDAAGNRTSVVQVSGLLANEQMGDLLFNGAFRFFRRQVPTTLTSRANGAYGPDRWYMLGNSGATDIQVRSGCRRFSSGTCLPGKKQ